MFNQAHIKLGMEIESLPHKITVIKKTKQLKK